ncbi:MAG: aminopeptidase P family protein [Anaerolineales bacterium]|nr:MAG: aminopeptidase P family protein [Anaerolineales bacterium]
MTTRTHKAELESRIQKLQAHLAANDLDGALILQNTDLFYFSGTIQQSHLYIPAEGQPLLMTRKSLVRAQQESVLDKVVPLPSPRQLPSLWQEYGYARPRRLGMELDVLPTNLFFVYQDILDGTEIVDISHQIRLVRAVKSPYEVDILRRAARLADVVTRSMAEFLQEGISEVELAGKLEAVARRLGHQGIVRMRLWNNELFYGHLMAGDDAAVPSYLSSPTGGTGLSPAVAQGSSLRPIQRHEPVLMDYVFALDGYLVDQTRVFALGGLPDKLVAGHKAMLEVQDALRVAAKPLATGGELYGLAVELAAELGYGEHFMGYGDERITFVGHGVGLELDEYPFLAKGQNMPLEKGMVIALEPKLIYPGLGVVGIENTHLVTDDGLETLTISEEDIVIV